MMNESQLLGFCLKALIKNTISSLKIHIMKAMSPVHSIATVYCNMINHADENINQSKLMQPYLYSLKQENALSVKFRPTLPPWI